MEVSMIVVSVLLFALYLYNHNNRPTLTPVDRAIIHMDNRGHSTKTSIGAIVLGLILLCLSWLALLGVAYAQRYDSSYGYEQRGFVPPPSSYPSHMRQRRHPC